MEILRDNLEDFKIGDILFLTPVQKHLIFNHSLFCLLIQGHESKCPGAHQFNRLTVGSFFGAKASRPAEPNIIRMGSKSLVDH